ncbi:MAG: DUF2029 domain-containing protein [Actinobacteria bacterium]|nr:DUF2029 domain-containing protein [Actinomycetota bacterium]
MNARLAAGVSSAALLMLAALTWILVRAGERPTASVTILVLLMVMWAVFAFAAYTVLRAPKRLAIWLILGGGAVLQVVAMTAPPQTSTDYYRYAWDGRVQAAGINPYEYAPIDPALADLRDPWLFPDGRTCPEDGVEQECPLMNRPTVNTIYPPVSQVYFFVVEKLSPSGSQALPLQFAAGLMGVGVTVALIVIARARGSDPRRAVLWSWCPLVVVELGNNAHVDGLSSLLVVVALGLLARPLALRTRDAVGGGVALGLATATKLLPAVLLPSVIKRRPIAVAVSFLLSIVVVYLPYVWSQGLAVTGFLGGYTEEEAGGRYAILKLALPDFWVQPIAVVVLFGVALWALLKSDPLQPWLTGAATVGALFLVITQSYQWYALLLVPLIALGAHAVWFVVPIAMTFIYFEPDLKTGFQPYRGLIYLLAAVIVAGVLWYSRRRMLSGGSTNDLVEDVEVGSR